MSAFSFIDSKARSENTARSFHQACATFLLVATNLPFMGVRAPHNRTSQPQHHNLPTYHNRTTTNRTTSLRKANHNHHQPYHLTRQSEQPKDDEMTATRNPRRKRHKLISTAASVVLVSHRMIHVPRAMALCSSSAVRSAATSASATGARRMIRVVSMPEEQWRQKAAEHSARVRNLLAPGLTDIDHPMNSGIRRQPGRDSGTSSADYFTALDPQNPVYNFLIEYYGLKGVKGPRRLARWSPDPSLLLFNEEELNASGLRVEEKEILHRHDANDSPILDSGIFLEGATEEDFGGTLHLKGAIPLEDGSGTIFSPSLFYNRFGGDDEGEGDSNSSSSKDKMKSAAPFQWYRAILTNTINSEPIFHCHGLHEWAMQYHPPGSDPPPSGKYQSHMPLRVSREVINEAVERRGISCTHVDAVSIMQDKMDILFAINFEDCAFQYFITFISFVLFFFECMCVECATWICGSLAFCFVNRRHCGSNFNFGG